MALVQVVPEGKSWKVLLDGDQQGVPHEIQEAAELAGRALAKANNAEFQLLGTDGQVRVDSYGDPGDKNFL